MTEAKEVAESKGQENINNEGNVEEITELESAIISQVEYYFGDLNLPRDMFLQRQILLDDGWLPLKILPRFNVLAKMTKDIDVIAKALNKATSGLLELSADRKKVRRSPHVPIPVMNNERRKELRNRTIYAKGFPKDSKLDELLKYFRPYDQVEKINMRTMFKGSVFVTFKTKELAQKFIDDKPHKYQDKELIIDWHDGSFWTMD